MTVMSDDDPFEAWEEEFEDVEIDTSYEEGLNLADKTVPELLAMRTQVASELRKRREMLDPRTERGRELHSMHTAIKLALHEEGY